MTDMESQKINKILSEQGNQMLSLIAIANAHSKENDNIKKQNDNLKMENKKLSNELFNLQNEKNEFQSLFNIQTLLFILLIFVLIWTFAK